MQEQLIELLQLKPTGRAAGKPYLQLQREIEAANKGQPGLTVDRRKLALMVQQPVTFGFDELQALDTYLATQGKSLSAIFRRPTILESIAAAERKEVTFFLGSKPREGFNFLSHWDARAMADVLRGIERSDKGSQAIRFDVLDVPLETRATMDQHGEEWFQEEEWCRWFEGPEAPSLVCIGSPRASHVSEIMLARMFQVLSFNPTIARSSARRLPFLFVWPPEPFADVPSSFARCSDEYPGRPAGSGDARWGFGGLHVLGEPQPYWSSWDAPAWREYGVIAAQRRRTGQVWLYIGGVSGPSTYAAARALSSVTATLPPGADDAPVLWIVVEADVQRDAPRNGETEGDLRRVTGQKPFRQPHIWRPEGSAAG
jgi:hypothetical protein